MEAIDPEMVAQLLAEADKPRTKTSRATRVPGTTRQKKYDIEIRNYTEWFKIPTAHGECTVPAHDESLSSRKMMVAEIGELLVCRYCYVGSKDKA